MNSFKKYSIVFIIVTTLFLTSVALVTVVVDPYFHYHKPISEYGYKLSQERYQNEGILRHFNYDAIITGTSMTECFMTSEFDDLFGVHSVKVPNSGSTFKETSSRLYSAFESENNIKMVIYALDTNLLLLDKDALNDYVYPEYMYDKNLLNDINYLLNERVLMNETIPTIWRMFKKIPITTFDVYANWMEGDVFGKEELDRVYSRPKPSDIAVSYSDEDYQTERENLYQNIISHVVNNPDTQFFFFLPPYSIYYFDMVNRTGLIERYLHSQEVCIDLLLNYDNVHLFSFFNNYDLICDLNNHKDPCHYGEWVNSYILNCMADGSYEITTDNCDMYKKEIRDFYLSYDYDSLFN